MAVLWSNFLKIRADLLWGHKNLIVFMQIQSFLCGVCAEQRSPRTLQTHDEQTTSKNGNYEIYMWQIIDIVEVKMEKGYFGTLGIYTLPTVNIQIASFFKCKGPGIPLFRL